MLYEQQNKEEELTEVVKQQKDDYQPEWAGAEVGGTGGAAEVSDVSKAMQLVVCSSICMW